MISAGAAVIDMTPPPGLQMAGYVARSHAATGVHDPLTVRALVLGDCAIVVADVIGIDQQTSHRIRQQACLDADKIIIMALHTHGAPASMPGALGESVDQRFLIALEQACVDAVGAAYARARPCKVFAGYGEAPGVAVNRRHADGSVDSLLPVFKVIDEQQLPIATVISYACHPVVLGADNLLYTADYPSYVRRTLEKNNPGSIAIFVTGAAGDANTGHTAQESITLASDKRRTYTEAQRIGEHIARCAENAFLTEASTRVMVANQYATLSFLRTEQQSAAELGSLWRTELAEATGVQKKLLRCWIGWADNIASQEIQDLTVRVSVLSCGGHYILALPGEIFASTAVELRKELIKYGVIPECISCIAAYADNNPGYIPPASEFVHGGYEVEEAHRFYGKPATFAPDSVERLLQAIERCLLSLN